MYCLKSQILLKALLILTTTGSTAGSVVCKYYWYVTSQVELCRGNTLSISDHYWKDGVITAEELKEALSVACRGVPKYLSCVQTYTQYCPNKETIRQEAAQSFSVCDDAAIASWITFYVLPEFQQVKRSCIDGIYNGMCTEEFNSFRYPTHLTSVENGLPSLRKAMTLTYKCMTEHVKYAIARHPTCSASWQDVFFIVILKTLSDSRFGFRFYEEHLAQIQDIRNQE